MSEQAQPEPRDVRAQREVALSREESAWELRVEKGWSYKRIGEHLGITRQGAAKSCRRAERRILAKLETQIAGAKARQTCQLEHLAGELLEAWERSKKPGRKRRVTKGPDGIATTREVIGRDGDPRYIGHILAVLAAIRSIWGIGVDLDTTDPTTAYTAAVQALRAERLAALSPDERARRTAFALRAVETRRRELDAERERLAMELDGGTHETT